MAGGPSEAPLVRALTVEIGIHLALFALSTVAISAVVLPGLMFLGMVQLIAIQSETLGEGWRWVSTLLNSDALVVSSVPVIGCLAAFAALAIARWRHPARDDAPTLKPAEGRSGAVLGEIVAEAWALIAKPGRPPPAVRWFAHAGTAAHAEIEGGVGRIEVSAGLWERLVDGDPVARPILAHEMAHLVYRDPLVFRVLAASAEATVRITRGAAWLGLATTALMCVLTMWSDVAAGMPPLLIAGRQAATLLIAGLVLSFVPLSQIIVKRHGGFIASLMELRADVLAAAHSGGLAAFVSTFLADRSVRQSTVGDIGHSLLSPDLTHIPESERLALLGAPARLATPKLRYFAASLLLAFVVPLNIVTPYLSAGALNHLLMLGPVVAIIGAVVAMVTLGGARVRIPLWRCVGLGTAACVAMAMPRVNLEAISYLLICLAMWPGGTDFGGEPPSWTLFWEYMSSTGSDLADKIWAATGGPWFAASCAIAAAAVACLAMTVRQMQPSRMVLLAAPPTLIASFLVIAGTRDYRDQFFEMAPLSWVPDLVELLADHAWVVLWLPLGAAAAIVGIGGGAAWLWARAQPYASPPDTVA